MSAEKYTQKTLEAIRDAQALAREKHNQYLMPEHLLYALLQQDGGLIASIFSRMGAACGGLLAAGRSMPLPRPARSSPWRKRRRKSSMMNTSPWSI